jgi:hypothetical protein
MTRIKRNRMWLLILGFSIVLCAQASGAPAKTKAPRILGWKDLKVKVEFEDPFAALSEEQLMRLSIYARVQGLQKRGTQVSEGMISEATGAETFLTQQGVDIPGLLARREEITALRKQRASAMDQTLDGQHIRMPGYALPLEYVDKKVTEFLLVPWVGACIHTPPPPPNQIVHVTVAKGIKMVSRFEPVWIEGKLKVGAKKKSLYLVDGSSDINIGYSMAAVMVEKYQIAKSKISAQKPRIPPHGTRGPDKSSRGSEITNNQQNQAKESK